MWPLCTANNFLWLLLPLLIGLLTGWWAWGKRGAGKDAYAYEPTPSRPREMVPAAPVRAATVEPVRPAPAPASPVSATPAAAATTAIGIPAAVGPSDDLTQIVGIGPKLNELLGSLGVRRFDQIAGWGADEVAKVDGHLGAFKGRIDRDNWIEQARLLASGAIKEWQDRFGGGTNT